MEIRLVMMGVAGCGKSSLGAAVARDHALPVIEGDDFHSDASRDKMRRGIALTDADREGWLACLAREMAQCGGGVVLTCSALKRAYRERLRAAAPGLRFVFLDIPPEEARARVAARAGSHFFSLDLVDSQFATLERPTGEPGVLRVDARAPLADLRQQVADWLHSPAVKA